MTTPTEPSTPAAQPANGPAAAAAGDPPKPADPTAAPKTPDPANPTDGDKPLGPNGEKALQAERDARKELEKQVAALAPLAKLAEALGGGQAAAQGKSEVDLLQERFSQLEKAANDEREARWRAEVANEKGISAELAARLQGSTKEALAADADVLKALIPAAPVTPGTPKPDPTQGARGGGSDIDARIVEAESKGDTKTAISLKNQKLLASLNK